LKSRIIDEKHHENMKIYLPQIYSCFKLIGAEREDYEPFLDITNENLKSFNA